MKLDEKIPKLIRRLQKAYPDAHCALHHKDAYELLMATILSAQCTDKRVNMVTPELFEKFPNPNAMASASLREIEQIIQSTGFFRQKAKSLKQASQDIVRLHAGEVPETIEDLSALRGVGRKTANVVLGNVFDNPAGVVVDTHVKRLSTLIGLTRQKTPEKIETDLNKKIPKKHWTQFSHWLIEHGRQVCIARRPQCEDCAILDLCARRGLPKLKIKSSYQMTSSGELL